MAISMLKIRRPLGRLIFNMGIAIPGKTVFLIETVPWFNIKMSSYQYRKYHCGDKTIVRSSYLHNGISYTGKMSSLYWIGAQLSIYPCPPALHHWQWGNRIVWKTLWMCHGWSRSVKLLIVQHSRSRLKFHATVTLIILSRLRSKVFKQM